LTRLPNDGAKSELAFDCMRENLTTKKLTFRIIRIEDDLPLERQVKKGILL
jgi:hypothetical protein